MDTTLNVAYGSQITAAATRHNLDPRLLAAVAAQETGGPGSDSGRNIVGDGGHGHGLFQIDDRSHAFARTPAAMDPAQNADYAAGMLQSNLRAYGGNVRAALSAYNTGAPNATGTTTTWGDGKTLGYADSVLRHYAQLGGPVSGTPVAAAVGTGPAGTGGGGGGAGGGATAWETGADGVPVDALRELMTTLGASGYGASASGTGSSAATAAASQTASASSAAAAGASAPSIGMPQLPQYKPIQQPDGRDRDVAPSEILSTDDE